MALAPVPDLLVFKCSSRFFKSHHVSIHFPLSEPVPVPSFSMSPRKGTNAFRNEGTRRGCPLKKSIMSIKYGTGPGAEAISLSKSPPPGAQSSRYAPLSDLSLDNESKHDTIKESIEA